MQVVVTPTPVSAETRASEGRLGGTPSSASLPTQAGPRAGQDPGGATGGAPSRPTKHWIPGLDGLRALAVIAVVLFHLNPDYLSGGFLGVDLFFVISGYLITRLLVTERVSTGRISIGRFYLRRARRLLPAVGLLLAVVAIAGSLVWRDQRPTLGGSVLSSVGYVTNWYLIGDHQSYFVAMGRPPMLQHLWSLAIEEQYYLVWAPAVLLLTGGWLSKRLWGTRWLGAHVRRPVLLATVAALLAIASTVAMAVIAISTDVPYQADSSRVYFGTDTHAMGLLLGSAAGALAALPWRSLRHRVPRWVRPAWRDRWAARPLLPAWLVGDASRRPISPWVTDLLAVAGLAGVVWFFASINEYVPWLYRGGFLAFAAVALVLVTCAARPDGHAGRLLDVRPLKWIGERSYGIYLWHWPVFVVTRPMIDVHGPIWLIDITRAALAVTIAAASYRYIETPIRQGRFLAGIRTWWKIGFAVGRRAAAAAPAAAPAEGAAASGGAPAVPALARRARRHWAMPGIVAACMTVLVAAHLSTIQQPVWAASVPSAALPVPGVSPELPAGLPAENPATGSAGRSAGSAGNGAATGGAATGGAASGAAGDAQGADPSTKPPAPGMNFPAGGIVGVLPTMSSLPSAPGGPGVAASNSPAPSSSASGGSATGSASATSPATATVQSPTAPPSTTQSSPAPSTTAAATTAPVAPPAKSDAKVSAFGDSVLLGAAPAVKAAVGSLSLDAVVGRQAWDTLADVVAAEKAGSLAPVVLIHTGNNGIISPKQLASTLASLAGHSKVIVFNDHVDRSWQGPNNATIASMKGKYPNVVIVDWNSAAAQHPGWFGEDGIHVNQAGARGYAALVAAAIG